MDIHTRKMNQIPKAWEHERVPAQCDCWPFASHRTMEKVQSAFDALWVDVGNGYGSPLEQLIAEMQRSLDKANAGNQGQEPQGENHEEPDQSWDAHKSCH